MTLTDDIAAAAKEDRSDFTEYIQCTQCQTSMDDPDYDEDGTGSGICANCGGDGGFCEACQSTGKCLTCLGTGREPFEPEYKPDTLITPPGLESN